VYFFNYKHSYQENLIEYFFLISLKIKFMKRKNLITNVILMCVLFLTQSIFAQNVGINSTGAAPNASAMLDITSSPITTPATSLLVYNTATAGASPNNVTPGYYYWDGAKWVRFQDANAGDDWHINGNTGTNPASNFIGTTDNQNFIIRTNNTERIRVEAGGDVGVGTTTPDAKFHSHQSGTASGDIAIMATQNMNLSTSITAALFVAGGTDYDIYQYSGGRNALWAPTAIGHNNPSQMLDVNGNTRLRAHIYDSNNSAGTNGDILSRDAGGVIWVNPSSIGGDEWKLLGNAGTDPSINFWGTTDNVDLVVRTNNIERMRIQSDGTVSVGTDLDNSSNIYNRIMSTNTTNAYGIYNYHDGIYTGSTYSQSNYNYSATNSTKYGIYNSINSEGTGGRYGIYNNVNQNSSSSSYAYGIRNYVSSYGGTSTNYGIYSSHSAYRTGTHYGIYNRLYLSGSNVSTNTYASYNYMDIGTSTNTSTVHGEYTYVDYSNGTRYGEYKQMNSNSSYSSGSIIGDFNQIEGTGNNSAFGTVSNLTISGNGSLCGFRTNITGTGTGTHYGIYLNVPGGTNDYAILSYAGNTVLNEVGGNYDVRMESDTRTHMFWLDANSTENLIRFGTASTSSDNANGSTIAGTTVDYVVDFDNGTWAGTAMGIGSIEFLLDATARTLINNSFCPTTNGTYDLGYSTSSQYWDDVYADDFINVSDRRAKEDIVDITYGLDEILQLRPVAYKMINDPMHETKLGLIAQEVLPIVKEAVKTHDLKRLREDNDEMTLVELDLMGMKYMHLIPVIIKAIQEENAIVIDLRTKVVEQEQTIEELKQQNLEILKRLEELENK